MHQTVALTTHIAQTLSFGLKTFKESTLTFQLMP